MDLSDDEKHGLDEWELDCAARLQSEYGHSFLSATLLARYQRDWVQRGLERPLPLVIVTGI
jgi:hypothetical protein